MSTATDAPVLRGADLPDEVDVLVVGAGLSGVGMAARLSRSCPELSYAVVEARDDLGGTWDLFRYPGVRSDSDMFTFSFPFRPWHGRQSLASGADILDYVRATAHEFGVTERTHYGCTVVGGSWSTREQRWTIELETREAGVAGASDQVERRQVRAAYVHLASGYYRYDTGYDPGFEGRDDFAGQLVHPQFWPQDLDYDGKRVVVIGSGATAVTLVPALAERAGHVVMLQRTATYIFTVPGSDVVANAVRSVLPEAAAHRVVRAKNVVISSMIYGLSRRRPALARRLIMSDVRRRLPQDMVREHFQPPYGVWDQRLCAVPDGDFFDAIRDGGASVVTGTIDRFVPEGVRLTDGRVIAADIIVTATGLVMSVLGGLAFTVDGEPVQLDRSYAYRGMMLSGVPNVSLTVGYTNASWTLRADLVARYVVRLLQTMRRERIGIVVPVAPEGMGAGPILQLSSGYVQRAMSDFPKVGDREPWTLPQSYLHDRRALPTADLRQDMAWYPLGSPVTSLPSGAPAPATLDPAAAVRVKEA